MRAKVAWPQPASSQCANCGAEVIATTDEAFGSTVGYGWRHIATNSVACRKAHLLAYHLREATRVSKEA